ncbi:MAG: SusC/RagA family TonB-linked outer membrane protein [Marinifilaceae bacterium]
MKHIYTLLFFLIVCGNMLHAEGVKIRGVVYNTLNKQPIVNAQIVAPGVKGTQLTDAEGNFVLEVDKNTVNQLTISAEGFESKKIYPKNLNIKIGLMPIDAPFYVGKYSSNNKVINMDEKIGTSSSIDAQMLSQGYNSVSQALVGGNIAPLQIVDKGGMNGEGAYLSLRGIRSLSASNLPLIVVDGLPYLPNTAESPVISGYSKDIFNAIDAKSIAKIDFLKGADAAMYGSLAANGVISIQTERASSLETKVNIQTINGINWMNKRIPMMDAMNFKTYIGDIGETRYSDLGELISVFPFLKDDPSYHYNYLYEHDTDWQKEVYTPGFSTENMLKVQGGDAIANYALAVGFLNNKGVIENTGFTKYTVRLNANMQVTKKLDMFASVGFAYSLAKLMEQGMQNETNPLLAALHNAPIIGAYAQNTDGMSLGIFNKVHPVFGVSNPLAIVNDVEAENGAYEVLVNAGLNYHLTNRLKLTGLFGLFYNYDRDRIFVPGRTSGAIAPLMEGIAENTVRQGIGMAYNYYVNGNLSYTKSIGGSNFSLNGGYQLILGNQEYDMGKGINTSSDFYKTLNSTTSSVGRELSGHITKFNWMNGYANVNYDYKNRFYIGGAIAIDASSSTGKNAQRALVLPSANAGINLKNILFNSQTWLDNLMVRAEYSELANSRFSSKFSQNFYKSKVYRDMSGLVKGNIPNSLLTPERNIYQGVGADLRVLGNRIIVSADLYQEKTKDMLIQKDLAAATGFDYVYDNGGEMQTQGVDVSLHITPIKVGNFTWSVGGTISKFNTEIVSLGGVDQRVIEYNDGTRLISKVGDSPYSFYGYKTNGVISSSQQANQFGLVNAAGAAFRAGDVLFMDQNEDKVINDADMLTLGNAAPDYFGNFYTNFRYKNVSLNLLFTYSKGNEIYNVLRRSTESMKDFKNQSTIAQYRWTFDGQQTSIPKAEYGDPMANSRFSDRWIEDGSYIKLKDITLSYDFTGGLGLFKEVSLFAKGENLFTATKYLGLDPEFAFSYEQEERGMDMGKAPLAKSVKIGIKLGF